MAALIRALLAGVASSLMIISVGCGSDGPTGIDDEEEEDGSAQTQDPLTVPAATSELRFTDECRPGTSITIAAVGDVLLHAGLQQQSYGAPDAHHSLWKNVEPLLSRADLTYGNLEGPCAEGLTVNGTGRDPGKTFDGKVYSSYPQFNYHPSLITSLKESGFDVVSTANNHALDRRGEGADKTIDELEAGGLPFTGTKPSNAPDKPWSTITETRGVRIGWLACTFSTNGLPDRKNQVLHCYQDRAEVLETIRSLKASTDAVIVTPHWGTEYMHSPAQQEKTLAHDMLDAGATAIFGGHPHVVQPWERYKTRDGREGFVIYSLGNFVSGQSGVAKASSLVLYLGLTKGADGKVTINGVRHLPIQMRKNPWTVEHAVGDKLALTNRLLGEWNRIGKNDELVTNPHCQ